jgi:long-chain acyl-CoA synthetase
MEPKRLFDFIYYQLEHYPQEKAFGSKKDGAWRYYSTGALIETANKLSRGLLKLGVKPGDKIGLVVYENRAEWAIIDLALLQIGAINVPVYPTISSREYAYIFNDANVKYCFAGKGDLYDKVKKAQQETPSLLEIFTLDRQPDRPYWEDLFSDEGQEEVARIMADVQPEELATLIYTSGTTGNPKGVMLSHYNIVENVRMVKELIPVSQGEIVLSFLPLCHIFERAAMYAYTYAGLSVSFTGTDNLGGDHGDLRSIRPHFFTSVPRLLEKVYERIYNKGLELTGAKKALFFWALGLTDDYDYDKSFSGFTGFKWRLADKLIFSKWREALGGRVKGILTGAAPCPVKVMRVFSAAGIPVREAYGLTETSPGLTVNHYQPGKAVMGSVGLVLRNVEIQIDTQGDYRPGEGEIMASGPNVMMGYYQQSEATAAVIEEIDGKRWFRTGDVGTWVTGPGGQKFLKITDRKKELLKTSGGKYVAPAPLETRLKEEFLIEQIMVVGDQRKFVSALVVPAEEALREWCHAHGVHWEGVAAAIKHPEVISRYQHIFDKINPEFSQIDQVKKFTLVPSTWEAAKTDGSESELTPTMKLKRRVIMDKYAAEIEAMYA